MCGTRGRRDAPFGARRLAPASCSITPWRRRYRRYERTAAALRAIDRAREAAGVEVTEVAAQHTAVDVGRASRSPRMHHSTNSSTSCAYASRVCGLAPDSDDANVSVRQVACLLTRAPFRARAARSRPCPRYRAVCADSAITCCGRRDRVRQARVPSKVASPNVPSFTLPEILSPSTFAAELERDRHRLRERGLPREVVTVDGAVGDLHRVGRRRGRHRAREGVAVFLQVERARLRPHRRVHRDLPLAVRAHLCPSRSPRAERSSMPDPPRDCHTAARRARRSRNAPALGSPGYSGHASRGAAQVGGCDGCSSRSRARSARSHRDRRRRHRCVRRRHGIELVREAGRSGSGRGRRLEGRAELAAVR